jgi:hypothetical protein
MQKKKAMMLTRKYQGFKRHIAVGAQGFPHSIHVTTANIAYRNGG